MILSSMLTELVLSTGNDTENIRTILTRGVNCGIISAALKFHPEEYKGVGNFNALSTQGFASLSGTDWIEIDHVWNASMDQPMFKMDHSDLLTFSSLMTGTSVKYWSLYGDYIYYQPYPTLDEVMTVSYWALPDRVSADGDTIPLDDHLEYIMSVALEYYWSTQEESESQKVWSGFSDRIGLSKQQIADLQRALKGEPPYGDNV
jgi:hypothetical protein